MFFFLSKQQPKSIQLCLLDINNNQQLLTFIRLEIVNLLLLFFYTKTYKANPIDLLVAVPQRVAGWATQS